jgi:hypothetical protein
LPPRTFTNATATRLVRSSGAKLEIIAALPASWSSRAGSENEQDHDDDDYDDESDDGDRAGVDGANLLRFASRFATHF